MKQALRAFEGVKDQIGRCGIWCGGYVAGNGALRELTREYEQVIEAYGLEGWAPDGLDYKEFSKGLASIRSMPLCLGCLKSGGREGCEMKACATDKGVSDCGACRE